MSEPTAAPTHTYVARVWYKDTATLFNLFSFIMLLFGDQTFLTGLPDGLRHGLDKAIIAGNLWIRFHSSTRPVAFTEGATREVHAIAPASLGAVTDSTRNQL